MKYAASIIIGIWMLSRLYAQPLSSDKELEFTGRWDAHLPSTVIGTGASRMLVIKKFGDKYYLTTIHGNRRTVGVNDAKHIFQTTTIETGPYVMSREGDRFVYQDEKKQTNYLQIVVDKTRTSLNDGTYNYYWEDSKRPS